VRLRPRPRLPPRRLLPPRPRRHLFVPLALLALCVSAALGGCGIGVSTAGAPSGKTLTVYSSLPLNGPFAKASLQIVDGEKLALAQVGGRVGRFDVDYASLNDANPATGAPDPPIAGSSARVAAQDTSTIAFIGDLSSAATALSLSLTNAAGILQVSPGSPYVGLTSPRDAGQDEPYRFYGTGKRTFVRLVPGDEVEAEAQVRLMRALHIRRVYAIEDADPFDQPLVQIFAEEAKRSGIEVLGEDQVETEGTTEFAGEVQKVLESGAHAVFFNGAPNAGAAALWQQLHAADADLRMLGTSALAEPAFAAAIGAASARTYLTTPLLPLSLYPAPARRVLDEYRRRFKQTPGAYALYGYEAMSAVLEAIRRAGRHGDDREAVTGRFFAIRNRDSVLGRYSVLQDGDTTFSRYSVDRVRGGRLVFWRAFSLPPASAG
jgi:branched-chain amino acid transport system substrate-binding protein